jgi:tight adherence protein B
MEGLLLGTILGLGALLIFDGIARPEGRVDVLKLASRLGRRGASAAIGGGIALIVTGWTAAAIAGGILGFMLPSVVSRSRSDKRRLARSEAIAQLAARIRDSLRAGIGIQDALIHAARNAPPILEADLHRLVADARVSGLSGASQGLAQRVGDPAGDLFASALGLADRLGPKHTSELLDSLAESTTARVAVLREAQARQAQNRLTARVSAAAPILLLIAIRHTNPAFLAPFNTVAGQLVLVLTFALIASGYIVMTRMGRIEGGAR